MATDTKALARPALGKVSYDAAAVRQHAGEIEKRAGTAMTKLFPAGSDMAPSEAHPDIWRSWDEFNAIAAELESAAAAMAASAEQGPAATKAARACRRHLQGVSQRLSRVTAGLSKSSSIAFLFCTLAGSLLIAPSGEGEHGQNRA